MQKVLKVEGILRSNMIQRIVTNVATAYSCISVFDAVKETRVKNFSPTVSFHTQILTYNAYFVTFFSNRATKSPATFINKRLFSNLVLSMVLNAIDFPEKEFMRRNIPFYSIANNFYTRKF
jgi:hypothetical protein